MAEPAHMAKLYALYDLSPHMQNCFRRNWPYCVDMLSVSSIIHENYTEDITIDYHHYILSYDNCTKNCLVILDIRQDWLDCICLTTTRVLKDILAVIREETYILNDLTKARQFSIDYRI